MCAGIITPIIADYCLDCHFYCGKVGLVSTLSACEKLCQCHGNCEVESDAINQLERYEDRIANIHHNILVKRGEPKMKDYEVMYIIDCRKTEEELDQYVQKYNNLLINNGAVVEKTDLWGKKRLAYEIAEQSEGYYVLVTFKADQGAVKELDRVMKIDETVFRHMIIRKGE